MQQKEDGEEGENVLAFPPRQDSWRSDLIWAHLTDWERDQVRNHGLILNLMEPNWTPPTDD
jgi:hypothetical protein